MAEEGGRRTDKPTKLSSSVLRRPNEGDIMMNSNASTLRDLIVAFAMVASLVSTSLVAPAAAQDKVKVGVFPVSSTLPYFVAVERGFFKDQNIEHPMGPLVCGPPA